MDEWAKPRGQEDRGNIVCSGSVGYQLWCKMKEAKLSPTECFRLGIRQRLEELRTGESLTRTILGMSAKIQTLAKENYDLKEALKEAEENVRTNEEETE